MCLLFSQSCLTLRPHGLQHARPPCPSPSRGPCSNSYTLILSCHSTISSTVFPFSPCPQSIPASGYFSISPFFTSDGPSIGASASASVLAMNIQNWFPLGMTGLISLKSKGLLRVISNSWKALNLWYSAFFIVQLLHPYWKMQFWQYRSSLAKSSLCFLILLSKFVIAFLPRSESLLIACLQSLSAVILEPK